MRIIDTDIKGPSVRDVMTFGIETFPNAKLYKCYIGFIDLATHIKMYDWCKQQFNVNDFWSNYPRSKLNEWYFTYEDDLILFKLTWL